jgi:toxin YoeB
LTGKKKRSAQESVKWKIVFINQAVKDAKKLRNSGLKPAAEKLLTVLKRDPFQNPPRFEKLVGDLSGPYSRRINIQHRMVYQVLEDLRIVKVIRMWTHYE